VSKEIVIELKTIEDFSKSIMDKRFFTQIREMKKYPKQIIIIQGEESLYTQRNMDPNAIRGMLISIAIDYSIPIIWTNNATDTAIYLWTIVKREQKNEQDKMFTMHGTKNFSLNDYKEYIVSSFPGIGSSLSIELLKEFKNVKNIVNAELTELKKIKFIGETKAKNMKEVFETDYDEM